MYRKSTDNAQIIAALISAFALIIGVLIPYLIDFIKSEKSKGEEIENSTNISTNIVDETNSTNDNNSSKGEVERKVQGNYLDSDIYAVLNDSNINIKVKKDAVIPAEVELNFPYRWGIILSSSLEDPKFGDKEIELEIWIDKDYSVSNTLVNVIFVEEKGQYEGHFNNELKAYFDGQYFILSCNIENEYIGLEDVCIRATYTKGI